MTRNLLPITLLAFLFLATFPLSRGEEKPSDSDAVNVKSFTDKGVMMFGDISDGKSPFAKDPTVKKFRGKYFMYYSVLTHGGMQGWRIGIATSDDLLIWKKVGTIEPEQPVEAKGFCAPGAVVLGDRIHLFYQSYGNKEKDAICHAWSTDGIHFTRDPSNPVFHPHGTWTCGRAIDAEAIPFGNRLFLFFASRDPSYTIQLMGVAAAPLDSDFSRGTWKQLADHPILQPELPWEKKCLEAPTVLRHGNQLVMFYAGAYNNQPQQIGCATSQDGIHWKRLSDKPFLANGEPGSWNASESGHPGLFEDTDGSSYLFYQGNNDKGKSWYLSKVKLGWKNGLPFIGKPEKSKG
jgi:hypothetical protein